jgi:hypothetical protein
MAVGCMGAYDSAAYILRLTNMAGDRSRHYYNQASKNSIDIPVTALYGALA